MRKQAACLIAALVGVGTACSSGGDDTSAEPGTATTTEAPTAEAPTTTSDTSTTTDAPTTTEPPTTDAPTTTEPPTTTAAAETTVAEPSTDAEPARAALLTIEDFPEGWTEQPSDDGDDEEDQEIEARIDECVGLTPDAASKTLDDLDVRTPEFTSPDGSLSVEQKAALVADEATAVQIMAELGGERVPGCLVEAFVAVFDGVMADPDQTDFPPGTELGDVSSELVETALPPDVASAQWVTITLVNGDDSITLEIETWYQRYGRAISQLQFQSVGTAFPEAGIDSLTDAVDLLLRSVG